MDRGRERSPAISRVTSAFLLSALVAWGLDAQTPVFRSEIELVLLDVLVTDDGRPVEGLAAKDFEVRDNGVVQPVRYMAAADTPFTGVLVYDISDSVAGDAASMMRRAIAAVLSSSRAQDQIALLAFNNQVLAPTLLRAGEDNVPTWLAGYRQQGRTALRDAAFSAIVSGASAERSLDLLLTDGVDTASWLTAEQVLRAAQRSNVTIYAVSPRSIQTSFLSSLTRATGGDVVRADAKEDIDARIREIVAEFRRRYVIGFAPSSETPGWHTLHVRVKRRGVDVRTRPGYDRFAAPAVR